MKMNYTKALELKSQFTCTVERVRLSSFSEGRYFIRVLNSTPVVAYELRKDAGRKLMAA